MQLMTERARTRIKVAKEVALWAATLLLVLVCFRSGWLKVTSNISWVRDFHRWGYSDSFRVLVGAAELISAAVLLIPRWAGWGALLFAVVMLGAIYTHASHGELSRLPFNFLLLTLSLVVLFGRQPSLLSKLRKSQQD